jgi:hypothetical protein
LFDAAAETKQAVRGRARLFLVRADRREKSLAQPRLEIRSGAEELTTASYGLWPWVALARCNHLPLEQPCEAVGIELSQLRDPGERWSQSVCNRLAEFTFQQFGPSAGMSAALTVQAGHFQLLELLARTSPTVGDGLRLGCWFFPLLHSGGKLLHEQAADGSHGIAWRPPLDYQVHHGYVELAFAVTVLGIRRETQREDLIAREVWFTHGKPSDSELHARVFGCEPDFEMPEDRLVFDQGFARLPLSRRNGAVHNKALRVATDLIGCDQQACDRSVSRPAHSRAERTSPRRPPYAVPSVKRNQPTP